jgi:hypothetical protein
MLSIDCGLVRLSDAQIGLDYFIVLADRNGATFGNLLPEIEYRDYVRNAHDQLHVVLNDEKGHTRRLEEPVLAVHGLAKNFGGVRALSGIDMTISRGIGAE